RAVGERAHRPVDPSEAQGLPDGILVVDAAVGAAHVQQPHARGRLVMLGQPRAPRGGVRRGDPLAVVENAHQSWTVEMVPVMVGSRSATESTTSSGRNGYLRISASSLM